MESEQRRRARTRSDQRPGVHIAFGDDAFERCLDRQVLLQLLDGLHLRLRGFDRILVRPHQRLRRHPRSRNFPAPASDFSESGPLT